MNAHVPTTLDDILDELADEATKASAWKTRARIRQIFTGGVDAVAQRAIEHRAASDRKQVERPKARTVA